MKKTREYYKEYYKELLDLGYLDGQELTPEQVRQYRQGILPPGVRPENIVQWGTTDIYKYVPDIDGEEFMKKSQFITIRHLRTIKKCLVFIVVLIAINLGASVIAGLAAIMQAVSYMGV